MYRLMVVEDENMIREGIVKSIQWDKMGFCVVASERNGVEALKTLKNTTVDIILTDIKMPIMDGLELSKQVRELYPEVEIVILSGFSDFEYARQAISFSAFEYLLKPTNKQNLYDTFLAVKEKLDKRNEAKNHMLYQGRIINEGYERTRNEYLLELLKGEKEAFQSIYDKLSNLEADISGPLLTVAIIKFDQNVIKQQLQDIWMGDKQFMLYAYRNVVHEVFGEVERGVPIVKDSDEIVFVFSFDTQDDQKKQMIRILEDISNNIRQCVFPGIKVPAMIGIGLTYPSIYLLPKSFQQAQWIIDKSFYNGQQTVQVFKDSSEYKFEKNWIQNYPEELEEIASLVSIGNGERTRLLLEQVFKHLSEVNLSPDVIKNYCLVLKMMVINRLIDPLEGRETIADKNFDDIVKNSISFPSLKNYIITIMVNTAEKMRAYVDSNIENSGNIVIEKAKNYIMKNYNKKITLEEICEEVYLTQSYFSYLFKKVTGGTYIDFVQNKRIHEAKKLLKDSKIKIYEVGERIGYNDYKYFAVQFKKITGVSPGEYRSNNCV